MRSNASFQTNLVESHRHTATACGHPLRAQQRSALDKEQMFHVKRSESHHKAASGQTPSTTTRPRVTPPKEDGARNARPSARRPHDHAGGKPRSASGSRAPSGDRARSQDPDRSSQSAARALRTCTPCHPRALCERQPPWKTAFLALQASSPCIAKKTPRAGKQREAEGTGEVPSACICGGQPDERRASAAESANVEEAHRMRLQLRLRMLGCRTLCLRRIPARFRQKLY